MAEESPLDVDSEFEVLKSGDDRLVDSACVQFSFLNE